MFGYLKTKVKGLIAEGTEVVMALVIVGIMAGAGAIALGAMQTTNSVAAVNNTLGNASAGVLNLTGQLGTVGTVAAVGLVIAVIVSAFAVFLFGRKE